MLNRRYFSSALAALAASVVSFSLITMPAAKAEGGADVTVFAAASLKNALDAIDAEWKTESGKEAAVSFAASSALAKQIEQGAPADVFISADIPWMTYLKDKNLIKTESEVVLLGNRLVLIAPADASSEIKIEKDFDLAKLLGDGRLAVGNVDSVPAGKYAKEALEKLGVWDSVESKLAQSENVRAAMALVSTGEAPLGIVYETDAKADPKVKVISTFPEGSHAPIHYPAALIADAKSADAPAYLEFLKGEKAKALFEEQGFTVLVAPSAK